MKNQLIVILFLIVAFVPNSYAKVVIGNDIYIDNINGDDNNGGTSWSDAFKTLKYVTTEDIEYFMSRVPDNNIYIKATDSVYRTTNMIGGVGHLYFNATGVNQDLGVKKALIYGSKKIVGQDWRLLSAADSQAKLYTANNPFVNHRVSRAYLDGVKPQRMIMTADLAGINDKEFFVDTSGTIYYRNDSLHPADMSIEWIADHRDHIGIEGFWNMWIYGASLKYFTKGYIHGNCHTLEVADLDVSYSATIGVLIASGLPEGGQFHNITSHHNEGDGIHVHGYNNTRLYNCISHNNKGDGIVLVPAPGSSDAVIPNAFINHCTSASNEGYGFKIYTQSDWSSLYSDLFRFSSGTTVLNNNWTLANNLSSNNGAGEFSLQDSANVISAFFNGWYGENNTLFDQYSGFSNVVNQDPVFVDLNNADFHLKINSPYIEKGVHTIFEKDIDGDLRDQYKPDIGADEFY